MNFLVIPVVVAYANPNLTRMLPVSICVNVQHEQTYARALKLCANTVV